MARVHLEDTLPCRHQLDNAMVERLKEVLTDLPRYAPELLDEHNLDPTTYPLLFRTAVESIRGSFSASTRAKEQFTEKVLDHLVQEGQIKCWDFVGSERRQDYRVEMEDDYVVSIEAKGCGDGNNMTIWDRPAWADEFVIWSQCPDSLKHNPGRGVWSALSTRIIPDIIARQTVVDMFMFFDGRCGSALRRCPKEYGVHGSLRSEATDIPGQDDCDWLPPPSLYLLPRTVPDPLTNTHPPLHTLHSCRFANALLTAFGVPQEQHREYVNWVRVAMDQRKDGAYMQVAVGRGLDNDTPIVTGKWKRHRRD